MASNEKHIVYSGTRNLYPWMEHAAKGAWAFSTIDKVHLLIEDPEFTHELPDFIEVHDISELSKETFPETCANLKTPYTRMALMRVCYGSLFPELDRIFQMDVDTVVVNDIAEVWDTKMDGKWMAAVHEMYSNIRPFGWKYYNVGTALFNLDQVRKDGIEERLVAYLNKFETPYVDQDAWCKFCIENKKDVRLPVKYNEAFMIGYTDDPYVIHFAGYKAWDTNMHAPRREYLRREVEMSWTEALERHEQLLEAHTSWELGIDMPEEVERRLS